jgi:mediator of RNA polymerase II transcription subunit 23
MLYLIDRHSERLHHIDTICNFFYHLKYRHIGESIKDKIHALVPNLRPELKKLFKFITSEIHQQLTSQQQQQQQMQH